MASRNGNQAAPGRDEIMLIRFLATCLFTLTSSGVIAAGWSDFSQDIGHGFNISKMSSLEVCLSLVDHGPLLICPQRNRPSHGPIDDYFFTDTHLLIRTNGAKPANDGSGRYVPDAEREHFFIVDRHIENPHSYEPLGPLDAKQFHAMSVVPTQIDWQSPGNPGDVAAVIGLFLFLCLAVVIYGWPVLLAALVVLLVLAARRLIRGKTEDSPKPA